MTAVAASTTYAACDDHYGREMRCVLLQRANVGCVGCDTGVSKRSRHVNIIEAIGL